jgi:hypothetical protein
LHTQEAVPPPGVQVACSPQTTSALQIGQFVATSGMHVCRPLVAVQRFTPGVQFTAHMPASFTGGGGGGGI